LRSLQIETYFLILRRAFFRTTILGKTIQALVGVALAHSDVEAPNRNHICSLIICPSTLLGHWLCEIRKFFPGSKVFRDRSLTGNYSKRKAAFESSDDFNIVVVSYAILRSDIDYLQNKEWTCCILDEGHLLKNPKTGEFAKTDSSSFKKCLTP
jgi:TATA-binding protein-associated factor